MNISVKNLILRSYHDLTEPHKYRHNYEVTGLTRPVDPCLRYFVFIRPCQFPYTEYRDRLGADKTGQERAGWDNCDKITAATSGFNLGKTNEGNRWCDMTPRLCILRLALTWPCCWPDGQICISTATTGDIWGSPLGEQKLWTKYKMVVMIL